MLAAFLCGVRIYSLVNERKLTVPYKGGIVERNDCVLVDLCLNVQLSSCFSISLHPCYILNTLLSYSTDVVPILWSNEGINIWGVFSMTLLCFLWRHVLFSSKSPNNFAVIAKEARSWASLCNSYLIQWFREVTALLKHNFHAMKSVCIVEIFVI